MRAIAQVYEIDQNMTTYMVHAAPQLLAAKNELFKGAERQAQAFREAGFR